MMKEETRSIKGQFQKSAPQAFGLPNRCLYDYLYDWSDAIRQSIVLAIYWWYMCNVKGLHFAVIEILNALTNHKWQMLSSSINGSLLCSKSFQFARRGLKIMDLIRIENRDTTQFVCIFNAAIQHSHTTTGDKRNFNLPMILSKYICRTA